MITTNSADTKDKKPKNIIEKIWDAHVVSQKPGHPAVFAIDLMLIHEVTSPQAFQMIREKKLPILYPDRFIATLDHSIPTRDDRFNILDKTAKVQVETLRKNAIDFGIKLFDFDSGYQGVVHVIGPELGITQPGMTIVCGDSHTSTHGAFGAIAFGIGTTEVGYVLATNCLLATKPKTMKVHLTGTLKKGVYSKDVILKLIATIGIAGANGHIIEYTGDAISRLTMEERMTLCNMSIECGARAGLIAPDETTVSFLQGREFAPKDDEFEKKAQSWLLLRSDEGALYDKTVTLDVSNLSPMITWGTNPEQGVEINQSVPLLSSLSEEKKHAAQKALEYTKLPEGSVLEGVPIDWAFLGSCTNGRIEDLRIAASILQGKKISKEVTFYVVPGSERVYIQAENEGLRKIFEDSGAVFRKPGCSMCLGMNDDKVPAGKRCISSSNRNFVGRQGTGSLTHLASPATVAASAIEGVITSPLKYLS
jgi:3-isopropylmalate/(R)-2-methylmalate dehydratase large subunit